MIFLIFLAILSLAILNVFLFKRCKKSESKLLKLTNQFEHEFVQLKATQKDLLLADKILNQFPDGIIIWNAAGEIQRWLGRADEIFGYPEEEAIGKSVDFLYHPEIKAIKTKEITETVRETGRFFGEIPCIKKDGSLVPIETSVQSLYTERGDVWARIGINRDISERKIAEKILRALAEGTSSKTGNEFFQALVKNLAEALDIKYSIISKCIGSDIKRVQTIAFWETDHFNTNIEYILAETPCEKVIEGDICIYTQGLQSLFPNDIDLVDLNAESYLGIPIKCASGNILGHIAVLDVKPMEITQSDIDVLKIFAARAGSELEHKATQEALLTSKADLAMAQEITHCGSWNWDIKTGMNQWSDELFRIFGYEPQEFQPEFDSVSQLIHPEDRDASIAAARNAIENGTEYLIEKRIVLKNGDDKIVRSQGVALYDENMKPYRMVGTMLDITTQKAAEKELKNSEYKYRSLVNNNLFGIVILNKCGKILFTNPAFVESIGYTNEELLKYPPEQVLEIVHSKDRNLAKKQIKNRFNREVGKLDPRNEIRLIRKDGEVVWNQIFANVFEYKNEPALQVMLIDITESKKTKRTLIESEEKYRMLFERESDAVMVLDGETFQFEDANRSTLEIFGYSKMDFLKLKIWDISNEKEQTATAIGKVLNAQPVIPGSQVHHRECIKKDGTVFPAEISAGTFQMDGKIKVIATLRDISERIFAEQALRISEERYRQLFNNSKDMLFVHELRADNRSSKFKEVNDTASEILKYSKDEIYGFYPVDLSPEGTFDPESTIKDELIRNKQARFETVFQTKDKKKMALCR